MTRLWVIATGDTSPEIAAEHGGYGEMFARIFEPAGVEARVVTAYLGEPLPDVGRVDLAVLTGSPTSVLDGDPWIADVEAWTRRVHAARRPMLGVCYGHQLLAQAFGGRVEVSDRGLEIGTIEVAPTAAGRQDALLGPLFEAGPAAFHSVHGDVVTALPGGAELLGSTDHTPLQAFRLGDRTWAVQFHPEFTEPAMRMIVDARADRVRAMAERAGLDPEAALSRARASLGATPAGPRLLERFARLGRELVER